MSHSTRSRAARRREEEELKRRGEEVITHQSVEEKEEEHGGGGERKNEEALLNQPILPTAEQPPPTLSSQEDTLPDIINTLSSMVNTGLQQVSESNASLNEKFVENHTTLMQFLEDKKRIEEKISVENSYALEALRNSVETSSKVQGETLMKFFKEQSKQSQVENDRMIAAVTQMTAVTSSNDSSGLMSEMIQKQSREVLDQINNNISQSQQQGERLVTVIASLADSITEQNKQLLQEFRAQSSAPPQTGESANPQLASLLSNLEQKLDTIAQQQRSNSGSSPLLPPFVAPTSPTLSLPGEAQGVFFPAGSISAATGGAARPGGQSRGFSRRAVHGDSDSEEVEDDVLEDRREVEENLAKERADAFNSSIFSSDFVLNDPRNEGDRPQRAEKWVLRKFRGLVQDAAVTDKVSCEEVIRKIKQQFHDESCADRFLTGQTTSIKSLNNIYNMLIKLRKKLFKLLLVQQPVVAKSYQARFPNKLPPIDKMTDSKNIMDYLLSRVELSVNESRQNKLKLQTQSAEADELTDHHSSDDDYEVEIFDYAWVRFTASNRKKNCLILRVSSDRQKFFVKHLNFPPQWLSASQVSLFLSSEEYVNSFLVNKMNDRWLAENVRTRRAAYYASGKHDKELEYENPNSISNKSYVNMPAFLELQPTNLPRNDKAKWIAWGLQLWKCFQTFAVSFPLVQLPKWHKIFNLAVREKFSRFLHSHTRQEHKYGDFYQVIEIIDKACSMEASIMQVLLWIENHVPGVFDPNDLRSNMERDVQKKNENVDLFVSSRLENLTLLDQLYNNRNDVYKAIARGLYNPLVRNEVMKYLEGCRGNQLSIHEFTETVLEVNNKLGMIQATADALPPQLFDTTPGTRRVGGFDMSGEFEEKYDRNQQHRGNPPLRRPPPPPPGDNHTEIVSEDQIENNLVSREQFVNVLNSANVPLGKLFKIRQKQGATFVFDDVQEVVDILIEKHKNLNQIVNEDLGPVGCEKRKVYYQRLMAGKTNAPPSKYPPEQETVFNLKDVETFGSNAARHLLQWRNEWAHAADFRKRDMMTFTNFEKFYGPELAPLKFIGKNEPLCPHIPYWKQVPTIASDPNFTRGESFMSHDTQPTDQYEPPTIEDIAKIPTHLLRGCTRCSSDTHPYYLCAKVLKFPERHYCSYCCLGGHQQTSCPTRKWIERERQRRYVDPKSVRTRTNSVEAYSNVDTLNEDAGLETNIPDEDDAETAFGGDPKQDFQMGRQH